MCVCFNSREGERIVGAKHCRVKQAGEHSVASVASEKRSPVCADLRALRELYDMRNSTL